jgi:hypothetical protein
VPARGSIPGARLKRSMPPARTHRDSFRLLYFCLLRLRRGARVSAHGICPQIHVVAVPLVAGLLRGPLQPPTTTSDGTSFGVDISVTVEALNLSYGMKLCPERNSAIVRLRLKWQ